MIVNFCKVIHVCTYFHFSPVSIFIKVECVCPNQSETIFHKCIRTKRYFFIPSRPQDHRGRRHRVSEEPEGRDHPHGVLALRVRPPRPPDLHGRAHAEVHPKLSG